MILQQVKLARRQGARLDECAKTLELDTRTLQRWARDPEGKDARRGPHSTPHNKLTEKERREVLATANLPEYRDLSPKQIVPKLADIGRYLASESTVYRIQRQEKQLAHRGKARPALSVRPESFVASASNQVWSWDISYLRSPVRVIFYYLYLVLDVWSRKAVGWRVHEVESSELASELVAASITQEGADPTQLVLHQDNGGPMKGASLKATLEELGVMASYSRPRVSDDNPFSEALFRTVKYRPDYPRKPFQSLAAARLWVSEFVAWYNHEHLHSAISFVSPQARHSGADSTQLAQRKAVYERARARNPERWSRTTRNWDAPRVVALNPSKHTTSSQSKPHAA